MGTIFVNRPRRMVDIREIDLAQLGIVLPNNRAGIVALQPFLRLSHVEPFKVPDAHKPEQLAAITRTLDISLQHDHGEEKTHFTLFPELSIPGLEGVAIIDGRLNSPAWPVSTLVIGGVHGLSKQEYQALCSLPNTVVEPSNAPAMVHDVQWANCSVTWVKDQHGEVQKWIQPKICPAWAEQNIMHHQMFRGTSVYVFKARFANGTVCRFLSLICFDWIGSQDGIEIVPQMLESIGGLAGGENVSLHWVFILQCNEWPNHPTFLARITQVLVQQGLAPATRRDNVCLVFCNVSDLEKPGRSPRFGRSSLVFTPMAPLSTKDGCRPSYSGKSALIRGADTIAICKDTLFRENGPCIHSFSQHITSFITANAANKSSSLEVVNVHAWVDGAPADPRVSGGQVACCVKWTNDELDQIRQLEHPSPACDVAQRLPQIHNSNIASLRVMPSLGLQESIDIASCSASNGPSDADYWGSAEAASLETILDTLDVLRLAYADLQIGGWSGHGVFTAGTQRFDLIVVRGDQHEICSVRARDRVAPRMRHRLLLVSRDRDNLPLLPKHKRIFDVTDVEPGQEPKITQPDSHIHVAFAEILQSFINAQTRADLEASLNANLAA